MTNFLHIQIARLKVRPIEIDFNEPVTGFPDLDEVAEQGHIAFSGMVKGRLIVVMADNLVEVEGSVNLDIVQPCSRCLKPVPGQMDVPVTLTYTKVAEHEVEQLEEKELTSEELGLIPFVAEEIDLSTELAQEIIMSVPQRPLCRDACNGLCPVCGIDLNEKKCDCPPQVFHDGLAALKNFKVD
jgi:uncharacterized protein